MKRLSQGCSPHATRSDARDAWHHPSRGMTAGCSAGPARAKCITRRWGCGLEMPTEPGHRMSFAIAWPQALHEGSSDIVTMHERYALNRSNSARTVPSALPRRVRASAHETAAQRSFFVLPASDANRSPRARAAMTLSASSATSLRPCDGRWRGACFARWTAVAGHRMACA